MVNQETAVLEAHSPPNALMDTHPRTKASEEPNEPSPEMNPAKDGSRPRRSSCLLFQMFCVETYSFLPNQQSDGRDLARQGEPRHRAASSPRATQACVEVLERSRGRGGSRRCTLEDIFQIVIVVAVEPADRPGLSWSVSVGHRRSGIPRWCTSSAPIHSRPRAAAWCGSDAASASERSTKRRGWGRSRESAAAISWPDVSGLPPTDLVVLAGARPLRRRTAGSRTRHGGARRLRVIFASHSAR